MRLFCAKLYYYRFKYDIFSKGIYLLKDIDEFKTGDETQKNEFRLQFFCLSKYVEFCRIRGPPSFNLKKFKLKGENKCTLYQREESIEIIHIL